MPALPSIHALTASAIFFTGYLVVLGIKIDSLLGSSSFPLYTLKGAIGTPSKTYSFFHFQTLCHKTAPVPECLPQPPERLRLPDARARKPDPTVSARDLQHRFPWRHHRQKAQEYRPLWSNMPPLQAECERWSYASLQSILIAFNSYYTDFSVNFK